MKNIIKHWLVARKIRFAEAESIIRQVKELQLMWKSWFVIANGFLLFFAAIIVPDREYGTLIRNTMAAIFGLLVICGFVLFIRSVMRTDTSYQGELSKPDLDLLVADIQTFKRHFGRRPEKIGCYGSNVMLVRQARKIIEIPKDKLGESEKESRARDRLRNMYDSANMFFETLPYNEIFDEAKGDGWRGF